METASGAPRRAEGVEYQQAAMAPGLDLFRCTALSATLSTVGCAKRWREGSVPPKRVSDDDWRPDPLAACRGCSIGAAHAGAVAVSYSSLYGASVCPRCRKGVTRMIGAKVCISCYNRAREVAAGKNARGNAPTKIVALTPVRVRSAVNGAHVQQIGSAAAVDIFEPVFQTLRTTPGAMMFAFAPPPLIRSPYHRSSSPARRAPRYLRAPAVSAQGTLF